MNVQAVMNGGWSVLAETFELEFNLDWRRCTRVGNGLTGIGKGQGTLQLQTLVVVGVSLDLVVSVQP